MAKQQPRVHVWLTLVVLLGTAVYAIAEDLTLVTYYPSPRGVYNELRTRGNVQIGSIPAPADPTTAPRLHVVGGADTTQVLITANATQSNSASPLLRAYTSDGTTELFRLHSDSMFNLFVGEWAGRLNATSGGLNGLYNTFIGSRTGFFNTTGWSNTATGTQALSRNTTGNANTATGKTALESNTTGGGNTATGANALRANTTGAANTATGQYALVTNTIGYSNTAMGVFAMELNTSGYANTAIGVYALGANTTAADNTAIGSNAMRSNTIGTANVATGTVALRFNTTGSRNTATGFAALAQNTTGANNTAMGNAALWSNRTGANNTALGYEAGGNITTGSNNLVIGYDIDAPSPTGSNQLTIGNLIFGTGVDGTGTTLSTGGVGIGTSNPGTARLAVMGGNVGIGTTAPAQKLHLIGSGTGSNLARIRVTSTDNQAGIGFMSNNTNEVVVYSPVATDDLRIWLNGADRLSVTSAGRVGIGTTAPAGVLLHVRSGGAAVPAGLFEKTVAGAFPTLIVRAAGGGLALDVTGDVNITGTLTTVPPKAFRINHPLDPENQWLIHAAIEGPEGGVYYRGEARLMEGRAEVTLPSYFEALTRPEGRTVLVSPLAEADEPVSMLAVGRVRDGRFTVRALDGNNPSQPFYWEVKAVRADVSPLEVEVDKTTSDQ